MAPPDVDSLVILAAGRGTRGGERARQLHKALFPLGGRAVISHILEPFPKTRRVVIAVGHLKDQLRDYLRVAHPDRSFTFVDIPDYAQIGSGPGTSLLHCRAHVPGRFYLTTADTIVGTAVPPLDENWIATAEISEPAAYCTLGTDDAGRVVAIDDKNPRSPFRRAFTGIMGVADPDEFWRALAADDRLVAGERQLSNGMRGLLTRGLRTVSLPWCDTGDSAGWQRARAQFEPGQFDFSKPGEATYLVGERVIKWFFDEKITRARIERASRLFPLVPPIVDQAGSFLAYVKVPGKTAYEDPAVGRDLYDWLRGQVFSRRPATRVRPPEFTAACDAFYRQKTYDRLRALERKWGTPIAPRTVNGHTFVSPYRQLANVPWESFGARAIPYVFHGDLQLDNVIRCAGDNPRFRLVDWRGDFAGLPYGDLYYDLGKLYASLQIDYREIKRGHPLPFTLTADGAAVKISPVTHAQLEKRRAEFHRFIDEENYDLAHIELIGALVYLNMAPLHAPPLDEYLLYFGQWKLGEWFRRFTPGLVVAGAERNSPPTESFLL